MSPPALSYRALSRQGRNTWLAKFTLVLPFARSSPVESPSGPKPPPSPRYVSRADHVVTKRAPDCPRLRGSVAPWLTAPPPPLSSQAGGGVAGKVAVAAGASAAGYTAVTAPTVKKSELPKKPPTTA